MTTVIAAILALALAAAPAERYVYEFSLLRSPVGFVELELRGSAYTYRSVHLFNREGKRNSTQRSVKLALNADGLTSAGRAPASLSLVKAKGGARCIGVEDELSAEAGELCVSKLEAGRRTGKLLRKSFVAKYGDDGVASEISFDGGKSSFVRVSRATTISPPDFTGDGFRISGKGRAMLEPAVQLNAPSVYPSERSKLVKLAELIHERPLHFCTDFVRDYLFELNVLNPVLGVEVHGLKIDGDRAYPHVWVRVQTEEGPLELDPTLMIDVKPQTHLPLRYAQTDEERRAAGELWLKLMTGEIKVVRR